MNPTLPPRLPSNRPSVFSRIGMTGLAICPVLASIGLIWWSTFWDAPLLIVGGGLLALITIGAIIMAQTTPAWRNTAMITLGVLSALLLAGVGAIAVLVAIVYAACGSLS